MSEERFPDVHTCAEYHARAPFVASVRQYLRPWQTGGLGDVWDLPNALFEYVSILDQEMQAFEGHLNESMMDDGKV